jgi:hypothetical protein
VSTKLPVLKHQQTSAWIYIEHLSISKVLDHSRESEKTKTIRKENNNNNNNNNSCSTNHALDHERGRKEEEEEDSGGGRSSLLDAQEIVML